MKKLPIGIQTFSEIRQNGFLYVDKTEAIHRLICSGKYFFISRPRRFGKSLTLSTISDIFSGHQDLFRGLWIEHQRDWSQVSPVIHIQFNEIGYDTNGLVFALERTLEKEAAKHGITLREQGYDQRFAELIRQLAERKGKVVLLMDEYDKPIIDYLEKDQLPTALEHQKILKNFYSVLKSADPNIAFLLITGVSKFSKVSIFSDLNNLEDLTLHPRYATLMGYTQAELELNFGDRLAETLQQYPDWSPETLLQHIKTWYNGYSWSSPERVYNPFSILNFFSSGTFQDYWFKTGTPTFLVKQLSAAKYFNLNELTVGATLLENYTLDQLDVRAMLFQTGYLTIREADTLRGLYTLDYPNREVEQALSNHLIGALLHRPAADSIRPVVQLEQAFLKNDPEQVVAIINAMLKSIPSLLLSNQGEYFYHALVHLHFRYLGFFIQSEVHTSDGRMDAVVHTPNTIFILEFKVNQSADAALTQIKTKQYAAAFATETKNIVQLGINFDTEKHCVSEWKTA
jgi:Predicted AAA-ATPase/PD-(D/E)XK nuclease superfamily